MVCGGLVLFDRVDGDWSGFSRYCVGDSQDACENIVVYMRSPR